jgi:glycerol-3-phosphate dehydrogenase
MSSSITIADIPEEVKKAIVEQWKKEQTDLESKALAHDIDEDVDNLIYCINRGLVACQNHKDVINDYTMHLSGPIFSDEVLKLGATKLQVAYIKQKECSAIDTEVPHAKYTVGPALVDEIKRLKRELADLETKVKA